MIISRWKLKAIIQKGISFLPYKEKINYFFQKNVTKGVNLTDEYFEYKVQHAKDHIEYFKKYGEVAHDKVILELGTGWYPIVPILMYLTKSGKVISLDIRSWMTKKTQLDTVKKIMEWKKNGKIDLNFKNISKERWIKLEDVAMNPDNYSTRSINKTIGLQVLIQGTKNIELADCSVDFIYSNNTFEHIYKKALENLLKEFKRIIKPNGVMSHFIDLSDHFAHFDKSITIYNFLKYRQRTWCMIDNKIQPQNRLRFKDYKEMYGKIGIPVTEEKIIKGSEVELRKIKINKEFNKYSCSELAVSHGYVVSKMN